MLYTFIRGPWSLTRQILLTEGPLGLFRGLVPTFAREMPGYFVFFGGYEVSRVLLTPPGKTKDEIGKQLRFIWQLEVIGFNAQKFAQCLLIHNGS